MCLTIDLPGGRITETQSILMREDAEPPNCLPARPSHFDGLDMRSVGLNNPALTWEVIGRMKEVTSMNVIIKGSRSGQMRHLLCNMVLTVSGLQPWRAGNRDQGTIECLPDIVAAMNGQVPIIVDSGFRQGTDIYKAGSRSLRGRDWQTWHWGLGAFGQAGVERVLDLLNRELLITMRGSGTPTIASIGPDYCMMLAIGCPVGRWAASCCNSRDF